MLAGIINWTRKKQYYEKDDSKKNRGDISYNFGCLCLFWYLTESSRRHAIPSKCAPPQ